MAASQYSQYANVAQSNPAQPTTLYATQNQINQINQMQQMAAAYSGQPTYFAYAPAASAGAQAVPTQSAGIQASPAAFYSPSQQGYMIAASNAAGQNAAVVAAQQQQLQQLQQLQQQQLQQQQQVGHLFGYSAQQLANAGVNINGFSAAQQPGAGTPNNGQQITMTSLPASNLPAAGGYQLIDYRQLQANGASTGLPSASLPIDQFAAGLGAVPRPRIVNLRHHPYQRN